MGQVAKIALSGIDAFTDKDPDNFALYVDNDDPNDYILIKEKSTDVVPVSGTVNIAHSLGYVPFCLVYAEVSDGVWRKLFSTPIVTGGDKWFEVNSTNLVLRNTGSVKNFAYHIFYDNIT
jgi:hypothetical protein